MTGAETMIYDAITVNNLFIREWLNGILIPLDICMMVITAYTVWRQTGFKNGWIRYPGASSACALWWIFFADAIRCVLAWSFLRVAELRGLTDDFHTTSITTILYMSTGIIATAATLRCIWCLTPTRARHLTWIGALIFTVVFVFVGYMGLLDWVGDYVTTTK